jgi:hypothetical protein
LVEVGGSLIEEPERFHAASDWKNGGYDDQSGDSESVHRAGHRARLTAYRNPQMIVHHREATDGHRKLTGEFLESARDPLPAFVFLIA